MSSEHIEFSPYPICYDVSGNDERPKHTNWVIPAGTTMLVDYDHILQAAKAEADRTARIDELEQRKADYQEYLPRGNNNPYGYQKCIPEAYINARLQQLTTPKEDKETA